MSEKEIQDEVNARVEFKMNEFLLSLKNRVRHKHLQAFDMTQRSQYIWEAFKELSEMVHKETYMGTPHDEMAKERKWVAKEKAVDKICNSLDLRGDRRYTEKIRIIVSAIETAQNW